MKNILVILGSIQSHEKSVSSRVVNAFIETYKETHKEDKIEIIDVANTTNISFTRTLLDGKLTEQDKQILQNRSVLLNKFKQADIIVLGTPMWNFGIPGAVKDVIDTFCVAGETFKYLSEPNENGEIVEALIPAKKLVYVQAMGGMNVGESDIGYAQVKALFNFIGTKDITYVPVQATNIPGMSEEEQAITNVKELATNF